MKRDTSFMVLFGITAAVIFTACTTRTRQRADFICHYTNLAVLLQGAVSHSNLADSLKELHQLLQAGSGVPFPHYLYCAVTSSMNSRSETSLSASFTPSQSGMWYVVVADYERAAQCYFDAYCADPGDVRSLNYAAGACLKPGVSNIITEKIMETFFAVSTDDYMTVLHQCLFNQYNRDFIAARSNAMNGVRLFPERDGVFKANLLLAELCQKREAMDIRRIRTLCWELYERGYRDEWFANIMERIGDRHMKEAAKRMRENLARARPFEIVQ